MDDQGIIDLFFDRSEQAIAELDHRYGSVCYCVSFNILNNRLDAEECVNDAYLAVWNVIPPATPNPLVTFVCRIVRNLSLKRHSHNTAVKRNSVYDVAMDELEGCLASSDDVTETIEARELEKYIEVFLDGLSQENRVIFLRRYWFSDSYADIARRVGLTEKNISVRLVRLRNQLRKFLSERGVLA